MTKPFCKCEQERFKLACVRSDQRLCISLFLKNNVSSVYICYLTEDINELSIVEHSLLQAGNHSRSDILSQSLVLDNVAGRYLYFHYCQACVWTIVGVHPPVIGHT